MFCVFPGLHRSAERGPRPVRREAAAKKGRRGFTLIELLVVLAIMIGIMAFMVPAFNAMTQSKGVESAAYEIKGALETARSYAIANNTYTWVGFFEEDGSASSATNATPGVGRLVLSTVASKDGTLPYDAGASSAMVPERLNQLGKLIKIEGVHMATFAGGADETGTPFNYPVKSDEPRYTFAKAVQFSPRGEARVNNSSFSFEPVTEIELVPARGDLALVNDPNKAAIRFTGIAGNVTIDRP